LEDLGPTEKGLAEILAPVVIRKLTLCFSIVSIAQWDSSVFTGAWMGGPSTRHWVGDSGLGSQGN
jgi:hypothetical protein